MRNIKQGFVSLNQPSMVSDVLVSPGEIDDATEIIEESNSRIESRNDGSRTGGSRNEGSDYGVSKTGQVEIRVQSALSKKKTITPR